MRNLPRYPHRTEQDREQIKSLSIVKEKITGVLNQLGEVTEYAKLNYLSETSEQIDVSEMLNTTYQYFYDDCVANGIILISKILQNLFVFGKRQGLENALLNTSNF